MPGGCDYVISFHDTHTSIVNAAQALRSKIKGTYRLALCKVVQREDAFLWRFRVVARC